MVASPPLSRSLLLLEISQREAPIPGGTGRIATAEIYLACPPRPHGWSASSGCTSSLKTLPVQDLLPDSPQSPLLPPSSLDAQIPTPSVHEAPVCPGRAHSGCSELWFMGSHLLLFTAFREGSTLVFPGFWKKILRVRGAE